MKIKVIRDVFKKEYYYSARLMTKNVTWTTLTIDNTIFPVTPRRYGNNFGMGSYIEDLIDVSEKDSEEQLLARIYQSKIRINPHPLEGYVIASSYDAYDRTEIVGSLEVPDNFNLSEAELTYRQDGELLQGSIIYDADEGLCLKIKEPLVEIGDHTGSSTTRQLIELKLKAAISKYNLENVDNRAHLIKHLEIQFNERRQEYYKQEHPILSKFFSGPDYIEFKMEYFE